jgi:hypothetical protein
MEFLFSSTLVHRVMVSPYRTIDPISRGHDEGAGPLTRHELDAVLATLRRSKEPSIQWKVRVHVLGEDRTSRGILDLEEEIRRSSRVRALLSRRTQLGRPGTARGVYYKWQGIHWVLASLADIGYPAGDAGLLPLRDRILELWLRPSYYQEYVARSKAETHRVGVPRIRGRYRRCASQQGNALYFLTRLGIADQRADALVERLLHWQWPDGGWNCDRRPEADTSSFMETTLPMLGLAAYGQQRKSPLAAEAAERAAEVLLRRRLFKRARDGRIIHPDFVRLHYPLYYFYDFLGGLKAMARLGKIRDRRCTDALDLLERKRLPGGGWPAEGRYYKSQARMLRSNADFVDWGGASSKRWNEWVTTDALAVLVAAGRVLV